ncbi:hypothetical protein MJH12_15650, partial [bacterium]|nr:hypothetical protein [bacterium]
IHILKDHYQIILFDCRPILESSDFQAILNFCDLSILVVRAGFQSSIKIKNALSRLVNMKINSVEAVLSCGNEEYF